MSQGSEQISVSDLSVGMHVTELDRPWHETPFPIQGFYIRSDDEISALKFYCKHVFVEASAGEILKKESGTFKSPSSERKGKLLKVPEIAISKREEYQIQTPIKEELIKATGLITDIHHSMANILYKARKTGEVDFQSVSTLAEEMTGSIIRNPGALLFLSRIKNKDAQTYNHSLKTSIWAMIIAREYGLPAESIKNIGRGGLLCKIGRETVMDEIQKNKTLSQKEKLALYQEYPQRGAKIIENSRFHKIVGQAVGSHRERHDGSGFPRGLTGENIPMSAKILGIADYYEFLVESRDGKMGMSPSSASSHLFNSRDILFQADLVDKLIETIGVYPIGSNVILSNGKMAIITEHNKESRLYPVVRIIKDELGNSLETIEEIDLAEANRDAEQPIIIKSCLPFHSASEDLLEKVTDQTERAGSKESPKKGIFGRFSTFLKKITRRPNRSAGYPSWCAITPKRD